MIYVLASIEIAAGKRDEFLRHFHQLVPLVRAEDGCLEYGPAVDAEAGLAAQARLGEDVVMVVEKWSSLEALRAHLEAPHMKSYRETVAELVRGVRLNVLAPA